MNQTQQENNGYQNNGAYNNQSNNGNVQNAENNNGGKNPNKQQKPSPFIRIVEIDKTSPIQNKIFEAYQEIKKTNKEKELALNIDYYNELATKTNELINMQKSSEAGQTKASVSLDMINDMITIFSQKAQQEEYKSKAAPRTSTKTSGDEKLLSEINILKEQIGQILTLTTELATVILNNNTQKEDVFQSMKQENENQYNQMGHR
ncbi:hypothetical protein [Helicobacter pullorum]|uniref:Uncharacterized protein n=1 Tax=Helicobacter pullorum TaxID=35818 RepID=A0A377Q299_9HELI|nr:hypothetical protein [Helicobacter pullorum]STQ88967.1 Uncharacterised protein [Helicobacter pullorum]